VGIALVVVLVATGAGAVLTVKHRADLSAQEAALAHVPSAVASAFADALVAGDESAAQLVLSDVTKASLAQRPVSFATFVAGDPAVASAIGLTVSHGEPIDVTTRMLDDYASRAKEPSIRARSAIDFFGDATPYVSREFDVRITYRFLAEGQSWESWFTLTIRVAREPDAQRTLGPWQAVAAVSYPGSATERRNGSNYTASPGGPMACEAGPSSVDAAIAYVMTYAKLPPDCLAGGADFTGLVVSPDGLANFIATATPRRTPSLLYYDGGAVRDSAPPIAEYVVPAGTREYVVVVALCDDSTAATAGNGAGRIIGIVERGVPSS